MCRVFSRHGADESKIGRVRSWLPVTVLFLFFALPSWNYILTRPSAAACLCPAPIWALAFINLGKPLRPYFRRTPPPPRGSASQTDLSQVAIEVSNFSNLTQLNPQRNSSQLIDFNHSMAKAEKLLAERLECLREEEHRLQDERLSAYASLFHQGKALFEATNLLTIEHQAQLLEWGVPSAVWVSCYQRSKHGGDARMFHRNCDNSGATVSVMRLSTSRVIGGYWPDAWTSSSGWKAHSQTFLFSLTNKFKHMQLQESRHVLHDPQLGPTFGDGYDLRVGSELTTGSCNIGSTFECRIGSYGSSTCNEDFCGTQDTWSVVELEVFKLQSSSPVTTTPTTTTITTTTVAKRTSKVMPIDQFARLIGLMDKAPKSRLGKKFLALSSASQPPSLSLAQPGTQADAKPVYNLSAAVTYLLKPTERDLRNLFNSLAYLNHNFCTRFQMGALYPVLLFSDGCVDALTQSLLRRIAPRCRLQFEAVSPTFHEIPTFPTEDFVHSFYKTDPGFRDFGYGQMIRWNMRVLFEHPAVLKLDFIMRLDTDSSILTPLTYDPFKAMYAAEPKKRYAYYCSSFEGPDYRRGLHKFVSEYMQKANVSTSWRQFDPDENQPVIMPYNNIEVVDVKWWRSEKLQHFVDAIDSSLGIWQHRWGDAPIRGMAISLFLREDELLHLHDFEYSHPWGLALEPMKFQHVSDVTAAQEALDSPRFVGTCTAQVGEKKRTFYRFLTPKSCKEQPEEVREFYAQVDKTLECITERD